MTVNEIKSPSGLDLSPRPPRAVRLNKRAGVIFVVIVGCVLSALAYGIYARQQQQSHSILGRGDGHNVVAATDAGRRIAQTVPPKPINPARDAASEPGADDLQPPPGEDSHQHPGRRSAVARPTAATYQPAPPMAYHEATSEEKGLQQDYERELEAIAAPTGVGQAFAGLNPRTSGTPALGDSTQIATMVPSPRASNASLTPPIPQAGAADQNLQDRKEAFLMEARRGGKANYLPSTRTPPIGRYEIKAGWDIPAILEQTINSDLPGEIRALVRENVYDTASGRWLLIPQGSRLVGTYDSRIAYGQEAIQVVWNRIIFPDASSIDLAGMIGQDAQGASGFRDDVDHHYRRLLSFGLLTSAFSAAFQLSQSHRGNVLGYPSASETAGTAIGQQMSQLGIDVTRRNLNVQPTLKVHAGYRFNVRVSRDLLFDAPYHPPSVRRSAISFHPR